MIETTMPDPELEILPFASTNEFKTWMYQYHDKKNGIWIKIAKKSSNVPSITHEEALDIALCYGWIDSLRRGLDETYFLQKFTPRRPKGNWSKRNIERTAELIALGQMQPSGLKEINDAKQDGRWDTH